MKVNIKNKKIKTSDLKQGQTAIIVSPGSYNNDVVMCVGGGISKIIINLSRSTLMDGDYDCVLRDFELNEV